MTDLIRLQEQVGCDLVTDGELRHDNFYSFVAQKLDGVRLMTLAEMLDVVEDKVGFERLLQTLDVPAYSISNPTCRPNRATRAAGARDLRFMRRHTQRAVKVTLPARTCSRARCSSRRSRGGLSDEGRPGRRRGHDAREEVLALAAEGADFVQLDEPVLSELAFAPGRTRTFMWPRWRRARIRPRSSSSRSR